MLECTQQEMGRLVESWLLQVRPALFYNIQLVAYIKYSKVYVSNHQKQLNFLDYKCHLVACSGGKRDGCNSGPDQFQVDKDVQVRRDYPSFSQIKKVINENSKYSSTFWLILHNVDNDNF